MKSRVLPLPILPSIKFPPNIPITFDTADVNFTHPILKLNTGDPGPGVTQNPQSSGIHILRGSEPMSQLVWSEFDASFRAGVAGSTERVATISNSAEPGILRWNGANFSTSGAAYVNAINQNLATTSSPTFQDVTLNAIVVNGNRYVLPTSQGAENSVAVNNGSGQLTWVPTSELVTSTHDSIQDETNVTSITTTTPEIITRVNNATVQSTTADAIQFLRPILASSAMKLRSSKITTDTYAVGNDETVIVFTGATNCTITLPAIVANEARLLVIENASSESASLTVTPTGDNVIDGGSDSLIVDPGLSSAVLMSDGNNNWIAI